MADQKGDLSDEDQDIDIESDDDDTSSSIGGKEYPFETDKKAHHNALERKRRDHIKESFIGLRDCLPSMKREKASRAQILKQATDYIQFMTKKNSSIQKDIDNMRKQNHTLRVQVQLAEKNRSPVLQPSYVRTPSSEYADHSSDSSDTEYLTKGPKRLKVDMNVN